MFQKSVGKFLILVSLFTIFFPVSSIAGPFVAYSLREAEARHKKSGHVDQEVMKIGGITLVAGVIYDSAGGDVIIVGQRNENEAPISLDDLVAAIRALITYDVFPKVSIDKTPETYQTGKQKVRFEGGVENTGYGKALLEADVILKKLALGSLPTEIWGILSYLTTSARYLERVGKDEAISTRFWFYPRKWGLTTLGEVSAIQELNLGVKPQIMRASVNGSDIADLTTIRDVPGDEFAEALSNNYDNLNSAYPELKKLRILFALAMLAKGIKDLNCGPQITYWLRDYKISHVETPATYSLLKSEENVRFKDGIRPLILNGGIDMEAVVLNLQDGDPSVLKDAVTKTRPQNNSLVWQLPLEGWRIPWMPESIEDSSKFGTQKVSSASSPKKVGCYISRQMAASKGPVPNGSGLVQPTKMTSDPLPFPKLAGPTVSDRLPPQMQSSRVGGVMLRDTAKVAGGGGQVDLSQGNFSLVVDGQNARLAPETFRKFVTALWGVYFSEQDPGISIDPIAPGAKKQMVRYIGKVINSDLGRVMRDADYLMKKWAVGTERPNLPGFKDVDSLTVRHGLRYLGASRRFWFVPEDMRFKRGDDLLLFDQGRMTVKTEYILQNKGQKAEPADLAFAKFFTTHYQEIAARYPVYQELFEYAKMVSLAKYLKDQGVPLQWWLLAHKDLVITEDSPGTVDALAKGSEHYKGLYIEGGVNLGTEGHYVYDQQAVSAINAALQKYQTTSPQGTSMAPARDLRTAPANPYSFAVGKDNYTVLPQHSLTSGKDYRGIRYQTDLALRQGGKPGLEVVRYFNPRHRESGEFGEGWHLLVPYRIKPTGSDQQVFLNAMIPKKMTVVNLLNGDEEVLTFSTDRYSIAGYVPAQLAKSQVVGLFIMSDASYRLADKLGNEFWFNQAGFLTEMIFGKNQRFHLDYRNNLTDSLEQAPYQVQAEPGEPVQFLNALVPSKVKIVDLVHGGSETLTFQKTGKVAGYVPAAESQSKFRLLALMSDGSFQLLDQAGNETDFSTAGQFQQLNLPAKQQMVKAISHGQQKITFNYTLSANGRACIASAHWEKGKGNKPVCVARYEYDRGGRLARVSNPDRQVADAGAPGCLAYSPQ
jgi:hypothetical protein